MSLIKSDPFSKVNLEFIFWSKSKLDFSLIY